MFVCVCYAWCVYVQCVRTWKISIWFVARVLVGRYADRKADVNCTAGGSLRQSCERCQDESGDRQSVIMFCSLQLTHKEKHRYVRICKLHQPFQTYTHILSIAIGTVIALMLLRFTLHRKIIKHPSITVTLCLTLTGRITGRYKRRNISDSAEHLRFGGTQGPIHDFTVPACVPVYRTELILGE